MVRAQYLFHDGQRALAVRKRPFVVVHVLEQKAQAIKTQGRAGMIGAQHHLPDGQGPLIIRPGRL